MLSAADRGAGRAAVGNTISPPRLLFSCSRADGSTFAEEFERRIEAKELISLRDLKSVEWGEVSDRRARAVPRLKALFRPWNLGEVPQ